MTTCTQRGSASGEGKRRIEKRVRARVHESVRPYCQPRWRAREHISERAYSCTESSGDDTGKGENAADRQSNLSGGRSRVRSGTGRGSGASGRRRSSRNSRSRNRRIGSAFLVYFKFLARGVDVSIVDNVRQGDPVALSGDEVREDVGRAHRVVLLANKNRETGTQERHVRVDSNDGERWVRLVSAIPAEKSLVVSLPPPLGVWDEHREGVGTGRGNGDGKSGAQFEHHFW